MIIIVKYARRRGDTADCGYLPLTDRPARTSQPGPSVVGIFRNLFGARWPSAPVGYHRRRRQSLSRSLVAVSFLTFSPPPRRLRPRLFSTTDDDATRSRAVVVVVVALLRRCHVSDAFARATAANRNAHSHTHTQVRVYSYAHTESVGESVESPRETRPVSACVRARQYVSTAVAATDVTALPKRVLYYAFTV